MPPGHGCAARAKFTLYRGRGGLHGDRPPNPITMGNLKKKRRLKMNKHKRRKRLKANRHKKRTWQK
jgi:hypothetical protein